MPRPSLPFLHREYTRHGKAVWYVRRGKLARIRIRSQYGTPEFMIEYRAAIETKHHVSPTKALARDNSHNRQRIGNALKKALKGAKARSNARGLEFSITYDWILQQVESQKLRCALSDVPFYGIERDIPTRNPYSPSLDRIVPSRGYTRDNVRIILSGLNIMLLDWGTDVFETIARRYSLTKQKAGKSKR